MTQGTKMTISRTIFPSCDVFHKDIAAFCTHVSPIFHFEMKTLNTVNLDNTIQYNKYNTNTITFRAVSSFIGFLHNNINSPEQAVLFYMANYTTSKTEIPTLILTCRCHL